jgi:hypothetical protein
MPDQKYRYYRNERSFTFTFDEKLKQIVSLRIDYYHAWEYLDGTGSFDIISIIAKDIPYIGTPTPYSRYIYFEVYPPKICAHLTKLERKKGSKYLYQGELRLQEWILKSLECDDQQADLYVCGWFPL